MAREAAQRAQPITSAATAGVLISGAPSPLALALVESLQRGSPDTTFTFLVDAAEAFAARDACRALQAHHPTFAHRWRVLPVAWTAPQLGLRDVDVDALRPGVEEVWHLTAIDPLEVSQSTRYARRVDGTRHLLDLCESLPALRRFHHLSSTGVAGRRAGHIYEDQLAEGQDFHDDDEATRFFAEQEVQRRRARLPTTIYRPTQVVGGGGRGDALEALVRTLVRLPRWLPLRGPAPDAGSINIVPLDFVVTAMARLGAEDGSVGKVFHLADPKPPEATALIALVVRALGRAPALSRWPARLAPTAVDAEALQRAAGLVARRVRYDVTHTAQALGEALPFPAAETFLPRLVGEAHARL